MTIDNQIHARLTQIIVTSLYEEVGGVCFLFESLDLTTPPWFWPEPGTISCRYPAATPNRRILPPKGVRAENLFGSRWNKVFDETENGSRIVIGRVPSWTEYWSGSPPEALAREITLKSVDEYLQTVFSGRETSPSTLFGSAQKAKMNTGLPDKPMFGSSLPDAGRFGFGEVSLGPNAQWPNAGGPLDPWPAYRRTGSIIDCWERICCIGLDNERLQATAVVDITQISGYGGPICQSRSFLSVGFWLVEPSVAELIPQSWRSNPDPNINDLKTEFEACSRDVRFLGSTRISVGDVPRQIRSLNCPDQQWVYDSSFLAHAASLQLTSEDLSYMEQCSESMRLPVLHCVIAFNQNLENSHFLGRGVHFGHFAQRVVQFPTLGACRKLKAGVETIKILDDVTQARPVHVANLPNGDILFFSGSIYGPRLNGESEGHHDPRNSVAIFRPSTNEIIPIEDPPFDIFCSGHSTLANGNVVIIGGTKERATQHQHAEHWPGLRDVTVFDWRSMKFSNLGYMMREGR